MRKKIDILTDLIKAESWEKALAMAAKFPRLGDFKDRIVKGHEARVHKSMYAQLGYDVDALYLDGIKALKEKYLKQLK